MPDVNFEVIGLRDIHGIIPKKEEMVRMGKDLEVMSIQHLAGTWPRHYS